MIGREMACIKSRGRVAISKNKVRIRSDTIWRWYSKSLIK
jgi:hypothetical protein